MSNNFIELLDKTHNVAAMINKYHISLVRPTLDWEHPYPGGIYLKFNNGEMMYADISYNDFIKLLKEDSK